MTNSRILVTGATGKTGSLVVAELLKAGSPVRAMVHREDARSARLKTLGAVLHVTGSPAEDFETIARRYAAQPRNERTLRNWVREFAQFVMAPLTPRFNLDRYDRELRRPLPSEPRLAPESTIWRGEHAIAAS